MEATATFSPSEISSLAVCVEGEIQLLQAIEARGVSCIKQRAVMSALAEKLFRLLHPTPLEKSEVKLVNKPKTGKKETPDGNG